MAVCYFHIFVNCRCPRTKMMAYTFSWATCFLSFACSKKLLAFFFFFFNTKRKTLRRFALMNSCMSSLCTSGQNFLIRKTATKDNSFSFIITVFLQFFFTKELKFLCRSCLFVLTGYECIVSENYQSSSPTRPFKTAFTVRTQALMFLFLKCRLIKCSFIFVHVS